MSFSEAVQWWEEWQLQVLVLGSLFLHYFLYFAAPLRKRNIPAWFRFTIWLAYLGSDALAIYALAALFNRHKKEEWISAHREDARLQALWAPILLVHLGGVDTITAYNIEDNELWRRHVLTTISQNLATSIYEQIKEQFAPLPDSDDACKIPLPLPPEKIGVAIYVFRISSSGADKRLLQAAILIFIAGILKCIEKPLALKSASIISLMSIKASSRRSDRDSQKIKGRSHIGIPDRLPSSKEILDAILRSDDEIYCPFVDMAPAFKGDEYTDYYCSAEVLQLLLSLSFDRLYTKEQVSGAKLLVLLHMMFSNHRVPGKRICGYLLRAVVNPMIFTALGLFHSSHKGAYNPVDVKVTYTLLSCTASLEYIGLLWGLARIIAVRDDWYRVCMGGLSWPDQIAQYNLIAYLASNKKHWILTSIAASLGCQDYLDRLWCMKPCKSSTGFITLLVGYYIKTWNQDHQSQVATNSRAFSDNRGYWTLKKEGCGDSEILQQSLRRQFDESVLLWHLATELCYLDHVDGSSYDTISYSDEINTSRVISNYMAYLLFINPEMLMTGARPSLFREEYERLKALPLDDGEPTVLLREEDLGKKIIQKLQEKVKGGTQGEQGVAEAAWALSKELKDLCKDDNKWMWGVIAGVWSEMLCFSASRCRGYLHAKSLGKGGEFLSYIWLLLSFCGVETLADKMQRVPEQGDDNGGVTCAAQTTQATTTGDNNERQGMQDGGQNNGSGADGTTPLPAMVRRKSRREEEGINDGADCTTPATAIIGDEITNDDGGSHCTTPAPPPTDPIIGDNNV